MIGLFQELGPCGVDYNGDLYVIYPSSFMGPE